VGTVEPQVELRAPLAPAHGTHGLAQSRYGARGNLELVVPDREDGLWVYWRNTADEDVRPGAVAGGWSAGLHFGVGRRYDHAAVLQTRHGPDFVEVVAGADGRVERTFWSPGDGFSQPEHAWDGDGALTLHEAPEHPWPIRASCATGTFVADTARYPTLAWSPAPPLADDLPRLPLELLGPFDAISACRSTLDGGRIEVVLRRGSLLHHCALDGAASSIVEPLAPVETHAWVRAVDEQRANVRPESACRS